MWEKALNIALKYNKHIEIVLWYRKNYLKRLNQQEIIKNFQRCSDKYSERHLNDDRIKKLRRQAKENEERASV